MIAPPSRLPRRALLTAGGGLAAMAVLGSCTGTDPPAPEPRRNNPPSSQEATIFDLTLRTTDRWRPFELLAPGFVAVDEQAVATGPLRLAARGPEAPFAAGEVRLASARGEVAAGLATESGDHLLVRWSAATARVSLELRTAGRTRVLRQRQVAVSGSFALGWALCENQVTVLLDRGDGWQPVLTERQKVVAHLDLRRRDVLQDYRYAWSARGTRPRRVRAGLFGMTGVRDPHLVQHSDGRPYQRNGRRYLTWTCAGLGFFQQAHWSVWSFDPRSPRDMRLEAQLFSRRDGLVLGDHAGQLVRHGNRWLVAASSWGDFAPGTIHVRHAETRADLLTGVHVLDTEPTPLPTAHGCWDPSLTRVADTWQVAFVESPSQEPFDFRPALSRTTDPEWTQSLEPVFAAEDLHQCEGPIIAAVEGTTWLLASDGDGRHYPVYDLAGKRRGRLDAPYPTNIPHPQLVPDPAGGWWLITFNGTPYGERVIGYGTHGDVVLMHSV